MLDGVVDRQICTTLSGSSGSFDILNLVALS